MKYLALISFLVLGSNVFAQESTSEVSDQVTSQAQDEKLLVQEHGRFGGWRGGWGGGWGRSAPRVWPVPIPVPVPPIRRSVVCYAADNMGRIYSAIDWWATTAQQSALNQCYQFSGYCIARGCNYY